MKPLNDALDTVRNAVRRVMTQFAKKLESWSGGKLTPAHITYTGLIAHVGIAWLIAQQYNLWAAGLLVFFGLFDALDGALARLQGSSSSAGMLLDASTDRMKEVLLYTGAAYALVATGHAYWTLWAVAAVGSSLTVSYIKAKGETAVGNTKLTPNEINKLFADGLMRFEIRMFVLVVGLLTNNLPIVLVVITIASSITAAKRLVTISQKL